MYELPDYNSVNNQEQQLANTSDDAGWIPGLSAMTVILGL